MYEVCVQERFSAAHSIKNYKGKCARLHGHNFCVELIIKSERLNKGMVMDFRKAKRLLSNIVKELDHRTLDEVPFFKERPQTCENIAYFIYERMKEKIPKKCSFSVKVWEQEGCYATYTP